MAGKKYPLDMGWQIMFKDLGISAQDVLHQARLPLDLLAEQPPSLTGEQYFQLWDAMNVVMRDKPAFPLRFAQAMTVEAFSPPIFACFCSDNLTVAAKRLSYYKPLVGPLRLDVQTSPQQTRIVIGALPEFGTLPSSVVAMELAWWVHLVRMATRDQIVPLAIHTTVDIADKAEYEVFFGTHIRKGSFNAVTFSAQDAKRPFLTASDDMWAIFEPKLNKRMHELEADASFAERVRACLMEILASGQYTMSDVADRLAVSPRTLQRRLRAEDTSFQKELDTLREELARNYLEKSSYTSGQIAFLLGYEDPNSFYRAFRSWTGQTPEVVRAGVQ
ncbi:MAG: AraC family transcriptional regulator ligand-binding domain-containing protein [Chloroflexota bacterium]